MFRKHGSDVICVNVLQVESHLESEIDRMAHDIPRVALVDGHWVISKHECTIV